jgi:hypothetical protein
MTDGSHLTFEWLKMFLLNEASLGMPERAHLSRCHICLQRLSEAALDVVKAGRGEDSPDDRSPD